MLGGLLPNTTTEVESLVESILYLFNIIKSKRIKSLQGPLISFFQGEESGRQMLFSFEQIFIILKQGEPPLASTRKDAECYREI